jgi:hypothetical protein
VLMAFYPVCIYLPSHFILSKLFGPPRKSIALSADSGKFIQ